MQHECSARTRRGFIKQSEGRGLLLPDGASWCAAEQAEFRSILKDYVGRETPLYYARRLSERFKR